MMQSLPPELRRDLVLSLKTHRSGRPLSPVEVAEVLEELLKSGVSFGEIATSVGFESTSTLREIHRLLRLSADVRHLVGWGGRAQSPLSMTAASHIARLEDRNDQEAVVEAVLVHDLTSEETRQVVETRLRSGQQIGDCIETVLRLRPQIERKHLFVGAVTSEEVVEHLRRMTQRQRDELLRGAIAACFGALPEWTGSLSSTKFTLLGSEAFGRRLTALPNGFEATVNSCLEAHIETP